MFYYILEEYMNSIYNNNNTRTFREFSITEKVMSFVLISSGIGFLVFMLLNILYAYGISLIILIVDMIFIIRYSDRRCKKSNLILVEEYKNNKLEKLTKLLKYKEWNLYNSKGIAWIIEMCNQKLSEEKTLLTYINPVKTFFGSIIYPIIAAVTAIVINDMDSVEVVRLAILVIGILVEIFAIGYMVLPLFEGVANKKKEIIKKLRDDLKYLQMKIGS